MHYIILSLEGMKEKNRNTTALANLYAGLKGREIGGLIGLDYSTVSVGRKRLREKMLNNSLQNLVRRIEDSLSIIKI